MGTSSQDEEERVSHRSSPRPSSMGRRPIKSTDEQDVHTGWRRAYLTYRRAGQSAKVKRFTRRRERAEARRDIKREIAGLR